LASTSTPAFIVEAMAYDAVLLLMLE